MDTNPTRFTCQLLLFTRQRIIFVLFLVLMKTQDLITVNQAARLRGVSRQTIHKAIKDGKLAAVEVPAVTYRVSARAVEDLDVSDKRQLAGRRHGGRPRKVEKTVNVSAG